MTRILSHRQALLAIGLLGGAYIGLFLLATYWPGGDINASSSWFSLTPTQAFSVVLFPGIVVLAWTMTPLGIILLALSASRRNLRDYGLLTFFMGGICAILALSA